jgi:hypothetical protein
VTHFHQYPLYRADHWQPLSQLLGIPIYHLLKTHYSILTIIRVTIRERGNVKTIGNLEIEQAIGQEFDAVYHFALIN